VNRLESLLGSLRRCCETFPDVLTQLECSGGLQTFRRLAVPWGAISCSPASRRRIRRSRSTSPGLSCRATAYGSSANSFITDLPLNRDTLAELAARGRARGKIENETFNVLKNNGYHIEHSFGHGKQHHGGDHQLSDLLKLG
jgi:hypothetical protein